MLQSPDFFRRRRLFPHHDAHTAPLQHFFPVRRDLVFLIDAVFLPVIPFLGKVYAFHFAPLEQYFVPNTEFPVDDHRLVDTLIPIPGWCVRPPAVKKKIENLRIRRRHRINDPDFDVVERLAIFVHDGSVNERSGYGPRDLDQDKQADNPQKEEKE